MTHWQEIGTFWITSQVSVGLAEFEFLQSEPQIEDTVLLRTSLGQIWLGFFLKCKSVVGHYALIEYVQRQRDRITLQGR